LTITTFPYRIDRWDADGISAPLADIDDLIVAREPLINLRIMAHFGFDSRATVWTGS
jgi:hypothetical protein